MYTKMSRADESSWRELLRESIRSGLTFDPTSLPEGIDPDNFDELEMVGGSKALEALQGLMGESDVSEMLEQLGVLEPPSEEQHDG